MEALVTERTGPVRLCKLRMHHHVGGSGSCTVSEWLELPDANTLGKVSVCRTFASPELG